VCRERAAKLHKAPVGLWSTTRELFLWHCSGVFLRLWPSLPTRHPTPKRQPCLYKQCTLPHPNHPSSRETWADDRIELGTRGERNALLSYYGTREWATGQHAHGRGAGDMQTSVVKEGETREGAKINRFSACFQFRQAHLDRSSLHIYTVGQRLCMRHLYRTNCVSLCRLRVRMNAGCPSAL